MIMHTSSVQYNLFEVKLGRLHGIEMQYTLKPMLAEAENNEKNSRRKAACFFAVASHDFVETLTRKVLAHTHTEREAMHLSAVTVCEPNDYGPENN